MTYTYICQDNKDTFCLFLSYYVLIIEGVNCIPENNYYIVYLFIYLFIYLFKPYLTRVTHPAQLIIWGPHKI